MTHPKYFHRFDFREGYSNNPCSIRCISCGRWTDQGYYDPQGKAFHAYYCFPCNNDLVRAYEDVRGKLSVR
jgi:hypothetical protein